MKKEKVNIRLMTEADIPLVVKGEEEIFGESLGYDMLKGELSLNPYACYFVLEINKEFSGYISTWVYEDRAEILNFFVLKNYQGKGYGKLLLETFLDVVKMANVPSVSLEVRESNYIARNLYEKYNFKYSHTRKNYYSNGENALVYIKDNK